MRTLEIEASAATDNPLVLVGKRAKSSRAAIFTPSPSPFAADQIALAISEIGAISSGASRPSSTRR